MKTLCLSAMLLLLLAVCCSDAMPHSVSGAMPGSCCFDFSTRPIPRDRVSDIVETHRSCTRKAFIVQTVRGRQICYSQTFEWAAGLFNQRHPTEGSGLRD